MSYIPESENKQLAKTVLVAIDRPFQLLSAICAINDQQFGLVSKVDVLIDPQFSHAEVLYRKLLRVKCFDNVYLATGQQDRPENLGIAFIRYACTQKMDNITQWYYDSFPIMRHECSYDVLICGSINALTFSAKYVNVHNGNTIMVDEGEGSHDGTVFRLFSCLDNVFSASSIYGKSWIERQLKRFVLKRSGFQLQMNIEELWLFSIGNLERRLYQNIKLHELSVRPSLKILEKIFLDQKEKTIYRKSIIIFLTASGCASDRIRKKEIELIRIIKKHVKNIAIRLHPNRSKDDFCEWEECLLGSESNWELAFLSGWMDERNILIGIGSSGQFTPKRIAGVEPTVIFTYKMINGDKTFNTNNMDAHVLELRNQYTHPNKVATPSNANEMINTLMRLD